VIPVQRIIWKHASTAYQDFLLLDFPNKLYALLTPLSITGFILIVIIRVFFDQSPFIEDPLFTGLSYLIIALVGTAFIVEVYAFLRNSLPKAWADPKGKWAITVLVAFISAYSYVYTEHDINAITDTVPHAYSHTALSAIALINIPMTVFPIIAMLIVWGALIGGIVTLYRARTHNDPTKIQKTWIVPTRFFGGIILSSMILLTPIHYDLSGFSSRIKRAALTFIDYYKFHDCINVQLPNRVAPLGGNKISVASYKNKRWEFRTTICQTKDYQQTIST